MIESLQKKDMNERGSRALIRRTKNNRVRLCQACKIIIHWLRDSWKTTNSCNCNWFPATNFACVLYCER